METTVSLQNVVYKTDQGTPVTDSLKVAQVFGKQHKNILQAIRNLISTAENSALPRWFHESSYVAENGKENPIFIMNRDGFSLLAMGLTGEKAMKFKIGFIDQFNQMEQAIKNASQQHQIPQTFAEALKLAAKQAEELEQANKVIEEQRPKALFADAVATSTQSCLVGELAKILRQNGIEIGQNRLFEYLRQRGYLCQYGERYNQPTQRSMDMELFEIKKTSITKPDGTVLVTVTSKVTGKGQIYFVNHFLKKQNYAIPA